MPAAKSAAKTKTTPKSAAKAGKPAKPVAVATVGARPLKHGDHLFLVDGSSYIFRAYHALPPLNRKSDGLQINAVLGFCNMLWKLLREMKPEERPTHLAVVFDKSEHTFRNELYPDYKAHRPDAPDDLIPQFGLIREAVRAFDIPCLEQLGFEADDLIATYARLAEEAGATTTIVASDKDLMQLIGHGVVMYDTMKDRRIGREEVIEKFGVPPEKVIDAQALIGDSTDNVPGVPGIGPKTAAELLKEYGDLDGVLAHAGEIKQPKRREALITNAEQARLSRKLVTLDRNVPLDVPADDLAVHEPDYRHLVAFLKAMEFSTLIRRVAEQADIDASAIEPDARLAAGGAGPDATPLGEPAAAKTASPATDLFGGLPAQSRGTGTRAPSPATAGKETEGLDELSPLTPQALATARIQEASAAKFDRTKYAIVRDAKALEAWVARAHDTGLAAVSIAATSADAMQAELCGIALAVAPNETCYVPLAHRAQASSAEGESGLFAAGRDADQLDEQVALDLLKPVLESHGIVTIGHDVKQQWLLAALRDIDIVAFDDVMLMSYVLDAGKNGHGLSDLAGKWFGHTPLTSQEVVGSGRTLVSFDNVAIERAAEYCGEIADLSLRLWRVLKPRLVAEHMATVYETLERAIVPVLARMQRRGISIDRQMLSRLSGEFAQRAAGLEAEIRDIAGEELNPGSPKQIGDVLFGKMGLEGGKKTKTGAWSTSASILEDLAAEGHVLPQKILDWRQVSKLRSTYTDALPGYVNARTQRVHTSYALAATTTGRLSSSEPNLQNIPIRTEEGRKIRRAFIAAPGMKLVSADYSQIELRLLAEIADVPALRQAFLDGLDIHAMTASEMFGVPIKGMPPEVRRRAKAINFGIIYGISAFGLANQLSIPREEAAAYIKKYFERFPGIRDYMDASKEYCKKHGYVTTLFGRKCHYPEIGASNPSIRAFNERAAINARLQGTAADIIRRAMIRIEPALTKAKLSAQMLLQVHDELVFEVPEEEVAATLPVVSSVMEEAPLPAVSLSVPLSVEARAADNWEEAH